MPTRLFELASARPITEVTCGWNLKAMTAVNFGMVNALIEKGRTVPSSESSRKKNPPIRNIGFESLSEMVQFFCVWQLAIGEELGGSSCERTLK